MGFVSILVDGDMVILVDGELSTLPAHLDVQRLGAIPGPPVLMLLLGAGMIWVRDAGLYGEPAGASPSLVGDLDFNRRTGVVGNPNHSDYILCGVVKLRERRQWHHLQIFDRSIRGGNENTPSLPQLSRDLLRKRWVRFTQCHNVELLKR
jgi:hypothetical protein